MMTNIILDHQAEQLAAERRHQADMVFSFLLISIFISLFFYSIRKEKLKLKEKQKKWQQ
jgi:hypothetical protein